MRISGRFPNDLTGLLKKTRKKKKKPQKAKTSNKSFRTHKIKIYNPQIGDVTMSAVIIICVSLLLQNENKLTSFSNI